MQFVYVCDFITLKGLDRMDLDKILNEENRMSKRTQTTFYTDNHTRLGKNRHISTAKIHGQGS